MLAISRVYVEKGNKTFVNGDQLFLIAMVALGGAIGAVLRYCISIILPQSEPISWCTFAVNFIGCFLICLIFFKYMDMSEATRVFLFIGIFGAFTTMSSVSLEMIRDFSDLMPGKAFLVFIMNAIICLGAGFLGRAIVPFI